MGPTIGIILLVTLPNPAMFGLVSCLRHLSSISENIFFSEQERAVFAKDYKYTSGGRESKKPKKEAQEKGKKVNIPFRTFWVI